MARSKGISAEEAAELREKLEEATRAADLYTQRLQLRDIRLAHAVRDHTTRMDNIEGAIAELSRQIDALRAASEAKPVRRRRSARKKT